MNFINELIAYFAHNIICVFVTVIIPVLNQIVGKRIGCFTSMEWKINVVCNT